MWWAMTEESSKCLKTMIKTKMEFSLSMTSTCLMSRGWQECTKTTTENNLFKDLKTLDIVKTWLLTTNHWISVTECQRWWDTLPISHLTSMNNSFTILKMKTLKYQQKPGKFYSVFQVAQPWAVKILLYSSSKTTLIFSSTISSFLLKIPWVKLTTV